MVFSKRCVARKTRLNALKVGIARRAVPARVQRAERMVQNCELVLMPSASERRVTAQRAVPVYFVFRG
jgi:hypothetical protein